MPAGRSIGVPDCGDRRGRLEEVRGLLGSATPLRDARRVVEVQGDHLARPRNAVDAVHDILVGRLYVKSYTISGVSSSRRCEGHMQFHHRGYVSGDPRSRAGRGRRSRSARGTPRRRRRAHRRHRAGRDDGRGATRPVPRRRRRGSSTGATGRLVIGQADGIQARSVETFQAFGFADRIIGRGVPDHRDVLLEAGPGRCRRASSAPPARSTIRAGVSEFPHLLVNQARVLDYFAEWMHNSPTRMKPDYGWEFTALERSRDESVEYPVSVTLTGTGVHDGEQRIVHAKYVVGADGARSRVRDAIGLELVGRAGEPRLGRHGRARGDRLPRHPAQVRDPVDARGRSCSSRARAGTCSACTSTSARWSRARSGSCAPPRSSRSSRRRTRSCIPTRST